jgi:hypothetical protein
MDERPRSSWTHVTSGGPRPFTRLRRAGKRTLRDRVRAEDELRGVMPFTSRGSGDERSRRGKMHLLDARQRVARHAHDRRHECAHPRASRVRTSCTRIHAHTLTRRELELRFDVRHVTGMIEPRVDRARQLRFDACTPGGESAPSNALTVSSSCRSRTSQSATTNATWQDATHTSRGEKTSSLTHNVAKARHFENKNLRTTHAAPYKPGNHAIWGDLGIS